MNIEVCGLNVNYIVKGKGENVLIIPGWGTTIDTYMTLIDDVSNYCKVYCLDMPGCGKTDEPREAYSVDDYVDFIISFIEKNKIKKLSLIGHSNGGRIIIKMMSRRKLSFEVDKVVLIASAGLVHNSFKKVALKSFRKVFDNRFFRRFFGKQIDSFKKSIASTDYMNASPVMRKTLVKIVNEDLRDNLKDIDVPVLLLFGEKDDAVPFKDGKVMNRLIKNSGLVKFENCGHFLFLEQRVRVDLILRSYFNDGN